MVDHARVPGLGMNRFERASNLSWQDIEPLMRVFQDMHTEREMNSLHAQSDRLGELLAKHLESLRTDPASAESVSVLHSKLDTGIYLARDLADAIYKNSHQTDFTVSPVLADARKEFIRLAEDLARRKREDLIDFVLTLGPLEGIIPEIVQDRYEPQHGPASVVNTLIYALVSAAAAKNCIIYTFTKEQIELARSTKPHAFGDWWQRRREDASVCFRTLQSSFGTRRDETVVVYHDALMSCEAAMPRR